MGYGKSRGPEFYLDPQLKYNVHIHDPRFYILAIQPLPTPGVKFRLNEGFSNVYKYISVTKHMKMNQKNNPCNEDPDYNFQLCVRNSLTSKVGCRLPWDLWSSSEFPLCSEIDQINKFQNLHHDLRFISDLEDIINKTGCIAPCIYKEYKLVLEPEKIDTVSGFYLAFTDNKLIIKKEMEFYSWISLVSDIGGALGLFLGFSFVMVWDGVELNIRKVKEG